MAPPASAAFVALLLAAAACSDRADGRPTSWNASSNGGAGEQQRPLLPAPPPPAAASARWAEEAVLSSLSAHLASGSSRLYQALARPSTASTAAAAAAARSSAPPPRGAGPSAAAGAAAGADAAPAPAAAAAGGDAAAQPAPGGGAHKALAAAPHVRDALLFALTALTLFVAAGGGIGGGAVFVPLYIFVGGFTASQAVALSNITILGGAVANFACNAPKRHASFDRPLIDWDLIMVMEPTTMLGALLGGYLNKLLPVWLTSCLLAALLVLLTYKLLARGAATFRSETRLAQQARARDEARARDGAPQRKQQRRQLRGAAAAGDLGAPLLQQQQQQGPDQAPDVLVALSSAAEGSDKSAQQGAAGADGCGRRPCQDCSAAEDQSRPPQLAVLPVPHGLRPLAVQALGEQPQAQPGALQPALGGSAAAAPAHVQSAARCDTVSPLIWSAPSTATAAEAEQQQQQQQQWPVPHAQQPLLLVPHAGGRGSSACCGAVCPCFDPARLSLKDVQRYERRQLPWQALACLLALSAWVVTSDTAKALLPCGSARYWAVVLSVVPPALLVTLTVRQWLLAKTAVKAAAAVALADAAACPAYEAPSPVRGRCGTGAAAGQPATPLPPGTPAGLAPHAGGILWTPRATLLFPMLCSVAGVFAGLFGVGGGIIKAPLMLELGVCPESAAATSATMIAFTAGSACVVYLNFGGLLTDYAVALLALGFAVTLAGQAVSTALVRLLQRRSLIIFSMATLMLLASAAACYQVTRALAAVAADPAGWWAWGSICAHH